MNAADPHDALEQLLDRALRELPPRRAPATLETRVMGELTRRAALPWWRRTFAHWPLPGRAAFLAICGASIWLALAGAAAAVAGIDSLAWARRAGLLVMALGNLAAAIASLSPPIWLYQGAMVCGVLYAVLFGLGAAVYRLLYLQSTSSDPSA